MVESKSKHLFIIIKLEINRKWTKHIDTSLYSKMTSSNLVVLLPKDT